MHTRAFRIFMDTLCRPAPLAGKPNHGTTARVLTILDTPDTPPTRLYAENRWRDNPGLHPTWWREVLGLTASKFTLDWRHQIGDAEALLAGVNALLLSAPTLPHARACAANAGLDWDHLVSLLVVDHVVVGQTPPATAVFVEASAATFDDYVAAEQGVRDGLYVFYGLMCRADTPLGPLRDTAARAAAQVWGRAKRPALRAAAFPFDLASPAALLAPLQPHKEEHLSLLELGARLGWYMLALPTVWPSQADRLGDALAALGALAQAEQQVMQVLGGWPHHHGRPVFSVLDHLRHGTPPWPTPLAGQLWHTSVFPHLEEVFQQVLANHPAVRAPYCEALAQLGPHTPLLALAPHMAPLGLNTPAADAHMAALLAAVPGLSGVTLPSWTPFAHLTTHPDPADIAPWFTPTHPPLAKI